MIKTEKELEKMLEDFIAALIKLIGRTIKNLFMGIKKLNNKNNIIGFLISFIITPGALLFKPKIFMIDAPIYIQYLIYYTLLFFPLVYLIFLGQAQDKKQEKYKKMFKEIAFIGPDSKVPFFVGTRSSGKKVIYVFKSNIPLQDWKKARERLETGMDCNILLISEGKSKKIVVLTTVPSTCQIPDKVDWSDEFISPDDGVIVLGEGALGKIQFDLNRVPHVLFAGETGSGKSVLLRTCLWQTVKKGCQVYMIDFKGGVEFGKQYEQFGEVITERDRALTVFKTLFVENERRLRLFRDEEVKNLKQYNKKTGEHLKRICVYCDEIGEMLDKKGASKEDKVIFEQLEGILSSLARLSRATGINLFLGVQRPDANVLTGQIKNNIPVRISGRFADKAASEIVLGNTMAVDLPDIKGRFLCKIGNEFTLFQAYYFDDDTMLTQNDAKEENIQPKSAVSKQKPENKKSKAVRQYSFKKQQNPEAIKKPQKENKPAAPDPETTNDYQDNKDMFDFDLEWEPDKKKKENDLDLNYTKPD